MVPGLISLPAISSPLEVDVGLSGGSSVGQSSRSESACPRERDPFEHQGGGHWPGGATHAR